MKLQLRLTWRRMTLSSPPFVLSLKTAQFSQSPTGSIQLWTTQGSVYNTTSHPNAYLIINKMIPSSVSVIANPFYILADN